jgi:DNA-entry nuclease
MRKEITSIVLVALMALFCGCEPKKPHTDQPQNLQPNLLSVVETASEVITEANTTSETTVETQITVPETPTQSSETTTAPISATSVPISASASESPPVTAKTEDILIPQPHEFSLSEIPPFTDQAYVEVNNNVPYFSDLSTLEAFELYSPLDQLGRCGVAYANICREIMPTEPRGSIGMVKPSGWQTTIHNLTPSKI